MDLICLESSSVNETETHPNECMAYPDPALLADDRALLNLLQSEEKYAPSPSYFGCVQKDISPAMRKIVADWMLEVCEDQKCQEDVFPLSMNYVDRFLSICPIRKSQLQLLGTSCLLLASKLRGTKPFSTDLLVYYTDHSITVDELWRWEQLVVSKLKWDLSAITANDFLLYILERLPIDTRIWDKMMIKRHAQTFISLSAREYKFSMYTPSMIAASSIAAALHGLDWTKKSGYSLADLFSHLTQITAIEQDYLQSCFQQIEEMVYSCANSSTTTSSGSSTQQNNTNNENQENLGNYHYHHHNNHQQEHINDNSFLQNSMLIDDNNQYHHNQQQHSSSSHHYHHNHQDMTTIDKVIEHEKAGTPTDVRDVHF